MNDEPNRRWGQWDMKPVPLIDLPDNDTNDISLTRDPADTLLALAEYGYQMAADMVGVEDAIGVPDDLAKEALLALKEQLR